MPRKKKPVKKSRFKRLKWPIVWVFAIVGLVAVVVGFSVFQERPCANSISCIDDLSGDVQRDDVGVFLGHKVVAPPPLFEYNASSSNVLGESTAPKHIYVNLASQQLYAYEGSEKVMEFPVSTGKWGWTPTGTFKIWIKLVSTRMEGGSGNDYYNLPNVPYTMFYYNDEVSKSRGFSIHGAYWHNNFGYTMSHGCVNMRPVDAKQLFEWADPESEGHTTYATEEEPGTLVTVYGLAPGQE